MMAEQQQYAKVNQRPQSKNDYIDNEVVQQKRPMTSFPKNNQVNTNHPFSNTSSANFFMQRSIGSGTMHSPQFQAKQNGQQTRPNTVSTAALLQSHNFEHKASSNQFKSARIPILGATQSMTGMFNNYQDKNQSKKIPNNIMHDKEKLYETQLQLRSVINGISEENMKLKTRNTNLEREARKFEKIIEEGNTNKGTTQSQKENAMLIRMRKQLKECIKEIEQKNNELDGYKKQLTTTRLQELEVETKVLYEEKSKLKNKLDQCLRLNQDFGFDQTKDSGKSSDALLGLSKKVEALKNDNLEMAMLIERFEKEKAETNLRLKDQERVVQRVLKEKAYMQKQLNAQEEELKQHSRADHQPSPFGKRQSQNSINGSNPSVNGNQNSLSEQNIKLKQDLEKIAKENAKLNTQLIIRNEKIKELEEHLRKDHQDSADKIDVLRMQKETAERNLQAESSIISSLQRRIAELEFTIREIELKNQEEEGNNQQQKLEDVTLKKAEDPISQSHSRASSQPRTNNGLRQVAISENQLQGTPSNKQQPQSNKKSTLLMQKKLMSRVSTEDVKKIGLKIKFSLLSQRIKFDEIDYYLITPDLKKKGKANIVDIIQVLQQEPFNMKKNEDALAVARYTIEDNSEDKISFNEFQQNDVSVIKTVFRNLVGKYEIFNYDEEIHLYSEISKLQQQGIKQNLEYFKKQSKEQLEEGVCRLEDLIKAMSEFDTGISQRHIDYITMKVFEETQDINTVNYLSLLEIFSAEGFEKFKQSQPNNAHISPETADNISNEKSNEYQNQQPEKNKDQNRNILINSDNDEAEEQDSADNIDKQKGEEAEDDYPENFELSSFLPVVEEDPEQYEKESQINLNQPSSGLGYQKYIYANEEELWEEVQADKEKAQYYIQLSKQRTEKLQELKRAETIHTNRDQSECLQQEPSHIEDSTKMIKETDLKGPLCLKNMQGIAKLYEIPENYQKMMEHINNLKVDALDFNAYSKQKKKKIQEIPQNEKLADKLIKQKVNAQELAQLWLRPSDNEPPRRAKKLDAQEQNKILRQLQQKPEEAKGKQKQQIISMCSSPKGFIRYKKDLAIFQQPNQAQGSNSIQSASQNAQKLEQSYLVLSQISQSAALAQTPEQIKHLRSKYDKQEQIVKPIDSPQRQRMMSTLERRVDYLDKLQTRMALVSNSPSKNQNSSNQSFQTKSNFYPQTQLNEGTFQSNRAEFLENYSGIYQKPSQVKSPNGTFPYQSKIFEEFRSEKQQETLDFKTIDSNSKYFPNINPKSQRNQTEPNDSPDQKKRVSINSWTSPKQRQTSIKYGQASLNTNTKIQSTSCSPDRVSSNTSTFLSNSKHTRYNLVRNPYPSSPPSSRCFSSCTKSLLSELNQTTRPIIGEKIRKLWKPESSEKNDYLNLPRQKQQSSCQENLENQIFEIPKILGDLGQKINESFETGKRFKDPNIIRSFYSSLRVIIELEISALSQINEMNDQKQYQTQIENLQEKKKQLLEIEEHLNNTFQLNDNLEDNSRYIKLLKDSYENTLANFEFYLQLVGSYEFPEQKTSLLLLKMKQNEFVELLEEQDQAIESYRAHVLDPTHPSNSLLAQRKARMKMMKEYVRLKKIPIIEPK